MSDDPKQTVSGSKDTPDPQQNETIELQADSAENIAESETTEDQQRSQKTSERFSQDATPMFSAQVTPRLVAPGKTHSTKATGSKLMLAVSLLAFIAMILSSWSFYTQYQLNSQWQTYQQTSDQQFTGHQALLQNSQNSAQNSLQTANANQQLINQQGILIDQLRQSLNQTQEKLRVLSGRQKQDWLLAEAEYLIQLAQLKITLEKDPTTAIALLNTADQRVLETADNSLLELRQVIAQDIADLALIVKPDYSGISSQLDAISKQIPQLQLIALQFDPLALSAQQNLQTTEGFSWQGVYEKFLRDFVTIKDHSQPVKPLMSVEQRVNLNSNIQLALQLAQISLVRGEQLLYKTQLNNASSWIAEFFQHNQVSQNLLQNLDNLMEQSVDFPANKKLSAFEAIQSTNQQRLYQWLESTNPAENSTEMKALNRDNFDTSNELLGQQGTQAGDFQ